MAHLNKFNLNDSHKNIHIPKNESYLKSLIAKTESFIKRVQWKVFHFENPSPENKPESDKFGFKTAKSPPNNPALNEFENDMYDLISSIEFRGVNSGFQNQMKRDIGEIRKSGKVILPADKSTNLYKVSTQDYNKLLCDSITNEYKKAPDGTKDGIDKDTYCIASSLNLANRMQAQTSDSCFIQVEDHKDNFDSAFKPYRKPYDTHQYIHKDSNHPPALKKNLPPMINRGLNTISCNETVFNEIKPFYQEALQKSGHTQPLHWIEENVPDTTPEQPVQKRNKKSRSRKILWYNPPFSQSVKTNIGKEFFKIIEKHFPRGHKFHKILNRNTVKLSYSCMPKHTT